MERSFYLKIQGSPINFCVKWELQTEITELKNNNDNKSTTYQNLWNIFNEVIREKIFLH